MVACTDPKGILSMTAENVASPVNYILIGPVIVVVLFWWFKFP